MSAVLETACPWCGETMYNPFTGEDVKTQRDFDLALEAHSTEPCEEMAAESGHPI